MQIKEFKNGAWTVFEKTPISGMYVVKLYASNGELRDKVRCDDYREARAYLKSFNLIAKNIRA